MNADNTITEDNVIIRSFPRMKLPSLRVQCTSHVKEKASVAVAATPEIVKGAGCGESSDGSEVSRDCP